MTSFPHLIPIVFGDWSNSGHKLTRREYVWSNKDRLGWVEALKSATSILGVDITKLCDEYEKPHIQKDTLDRLRSCGWKTELWVEKNPPGNYSYVYNPETGEHDRVETTPDPNAPVGMNQEDFEDLFFWFVSQGDPELKWVTVEYGTHSLEIHPGGYGLFNP